MYKGISILIALVGLSSALAGCVPQERLLRHVAEFRFGPEQATTSTAAAGGAGGDVIYNKTFQLPASEHTLFVTLSSTGDGHGGAALWFSALVNGAVCNPGNEGAGQAPGGWIPLQKHFDTGAGGDGGGGLGDMHDNGIYYTWCCLENVRPGGANTVQIKLASSMAGEIVFVERSHYYIDSVQAELCTMAEPIEGEAARMEALKDQLPPGHQDQ